MLNLPNNYLFKSTPLGRQMGLESRRIVVHGEMKRGTPGTKCS